MTESLSNADLLRLTVEGVSPLPGLFFDKLTEKPTDESTLADLVGTTSTMPLRFELQVRHLAIPCSDVLAAGVSALAVRYSGVGITTSRFLHETLAVLSWLTRPTDPSARQKRSFELLLREVSRLGPVTADLAARERDPTIKADLAKRAASMDAAKTRLPELAREHGLGVLQDAPGRKRLLDDVLGKDGGYGYFRMTSELAAHPSLMLYSAFADPQTGEVNVRLSEQHLTRAWWVLRQAIVFGRIAKATGEGLGWGDWIDTTMRPVLDPIILRLYEEVERRVAALP